MSTKGATEHHEQSVPVGFLELFYDLVFVAATMVLSNWYSHQESWGDAGSGALMFVLVWLLWFHTTVLMNVDRRDDLGQRSLVFAQMFVVFLAALAFVDHGGDRLDLVGVAYPIAVLLVALLYHRAGRNADPIGRWAIVRRNRLIICAAVMVPALILPLGWDLLLYGTAIVLLLLPSTHRSRRPMTSVVDEHHLTERAALLTLIVMGEALLKAALVISGGSIVAWDVAAVATLFVILFGLYSVYFDDIPTAGIRPGIASGELWLLSHLVLQFSIVGLAVGVSKYLQTGSERAPDSGVIILMVSYAGIFIGLSMIAAFDRRVPRSALLGSRLVTAAIAILLGLATLQFRWILPGVYLLSLAVLSLLNGVVSWRIREQTTIEPVDPAVLATYASLATSNATSPDHEESPS